jgi:hypothetical protein
MTFETVQRLAYNLGVSLRQAVAQPLTSSVVSKQASGVKSILPHLMSVLTIESQESTSIGSPLPDQETGCYPEMEANMAGASAAHGYYWGSPGTQTSWRQTEPRFSSPSVVSIPTREWDSPSGSFFSEPPVRPRLGNTPRTGISKPILCFLCSEPGHFLAESPLLPSTLQRESSENRAAYQRYHEAAKGKLTPSVPEGSFPSGEIPPPLHPPRRGRSGVFEVADPAPENLEEGLEFKRSDGNTQSGSENLVGGN